MFDPKSKIIANSDVVLDFFKREKPCTYIGGGRSQQYL